MTKQGLEQLQKIATITSTTEEVLIYFQRNGINWMLLDVTEQFTEQFILYRKGLDDRYVMVRKYKTLEQVIRYIKKQ